MIRKLYTFFQKETVLSISVILAVFSMFWIKPDHTYISYIDFSIKESQVFLNLLNFL